jgi:hypothetical protein
MERIKPNPMKKLRQVACLVSEIEDTRFATNFVQTDGVNAVATNGRALVCRPLPDDLPLKGLWTVEAWQRICSAKEIALLEDGTVEVEDGTIVATGKGEYPTWRNILKGLGPVEPASSVALSPQFTVAACRALGLLQAKNVAPMRVRFHGAKSPILVDSGGHDDGFVIIMPIVRLEGEGEEKPLDSNWADVAMRERDAEPKQKRGRKA